MHRTHKKDGVEASGKGLAQATSTTMENAWRTMEICMDSNVAIRQVKDAGVVFVAAEQFPNTLDVSMSQLA